VVTPFLPGDSLLFVSGALAATGGMSIHLLVLVLIVAAILGDAVNYGVGHYLGPRIFSRQGSRWLNPQHLQRANQFYLRHGGKTIIMARFIPLIRTYAPFVAGAAAMSYWHFAMFNIAGAFLWVASLSYAGYYFGNLPWVKSNLSLIILMIIVLSVLPAVLEYYRQRRTQAPLT
jgi:membrane-associated protein